MSPRIRNSFHVITLGDCQFEIWALDAKEATYFARSRKWAPTKSHVGIRRILRTIAGEQWPVVIEEAGYFTAAREKTARARQPPAPPDPELQELVRLFHIARVVTNDQGEQDRLGALLILAAQRLERSLGIPK